MKTPQLNKIYVFLFTNLFLLTNQCIPQINVQNPPRPNNDVQRMMKYWYYRERLVNDFMIGKTGGLGHGFPAQIRNGTGDPNSQVGHEHLEWGDQELYFSYYISVLATEYKLLSNWGQTQAADKTLEELYYALESFNNLDYWGEQEISGGSPNLNGFFVRDIIGSGLFDVNHNTNTAFDNVIDYLNSGKFGSSPVTNLGQDNAQFTGVSSSLYIDSQIDNVSCLEDESKDQGKHPTNYM